jgi:hypothetical protein
MMNVGFWQRFMLPEPPLLLKAEGGRSIMKSKIIATMVVVIFCAWLLPGCKLFTQDVSLPGTYWTLVALKSHELLPDSIISVAFKTSELIPLYIFGRMGCNDYSSPVELDE